MGIYLEVLNNLDEQNKIQLVLSNFKYFNLSNITIEQYHDEEKGEDCSYDCAYNVYRITYNKEHFVLKKSNIDEILIYSKMLENNSFSVPRFYKNIKVDKTDWVLIEHVSGTDLREFNNEMAIATAHSISKIHNYYWQEDGFEDDKVDSRFCKYWKRINKRAECLKNEFYLSEAYQEFLNRQLICPRTLCNGDFLQQNAIFNDSKVTIIDWAFGGIMPYSLDISRLITHGNQNRFPFSYYMTDEYRKTFINEYYLKLSQKPDYKQFIWDIILAALNECIEFIEKELNDKSIERDKGFDFYYETANKIADIIMKGYDNFILI
ncbi:MAG: phosphotransferase [Clostridium sp.]|uniref:phosphotransferase n=1 Tax=Clostridium sp. TaxID=1506 RepID=UPI0030219F95